RGRARDYGRRDHAAHWPGFRGGRAGRRDPLRKGRPTGRRSWRTTRYGTTFDEQDRGGHRLRACRSRLSRIGRARGIVQKHESSSTFIIRPSVPADAEDVWACLDSVARERRHIAMVEPPTLEEVRSFLRTLADRGVIQFVALDGPRVVGWCDVTRKPSE